MRFVEELTRFGNWSYNRCAILTFIEAYMKKFLPFILLILLVIACKPDADPYAIQVVAKNYCTDVDYHIVGTSPSGEQKEIFLHPGETFHGIFNWAGWSVHEYASDGSWSRFTTLQGTDWWKQNQSLAVSFLLCDASQTPTPKGGQAQPTPTINRNRGVNLYIGNYCRPAPASKWFVKLDYVDTGESWTYEIQPWGDFTLDLAPGKYQITDWLEDGSFSRGPTELTGYESGVMYYKLMLCGTTTTITPRPTEQPKATETHAPTQDPSFYEPREYYFGNNCVGEPYGRGAGGVYWRFTMLESFTGDTSAVGTTVEIFTALGESSTGSLPAGRYHIQHWFVGDEANGMDSEDNIAGDQDMMVVNYCPDLPLLPDAP